MLVPGVSSPVFSQEARSTALIAFLLGQHASSTQTTVKNSVYRCPVMIQEAGPPSPVTGCSAPPTPQGIMNQRRGPAETSCRKNKDVGRSASEQVLW